MRVEFNENNQVNFQARVSHKLESMLREYINKAPNRLKNNYKLNKKIEEINNYGFDNHTIEIMDRYVGWGREYVILSVPEGTNAEKGIFIDKKHSFGQILNRFMNIRKNEFVTKIRAGKKWYKD